jgi:hypothetical protein
LTGDFSLEGDLNLAADFTGDLALTAGVFEGDFGGATTYYFLAGVFDFTGD